MTVRASAVLVVTLVLTASAAVAQTVGFDDQIDRCEALASVSACDPGDGYLVVGPVAECGNNLACVEAAWEAIGAEVDAVGGGVCGQGHEDGGTAYLCALPDGTLIEVEDPPPPPAPEEISCPAPDQPTIGHDPYVDGLTGLMTYLWASPHAPKTSTGVIRGYPVSCTITAEHWEFNTGDGGHYTSGTPGGPHPDHAAEHMYETKGDYTVTVTVRWRQETNYGGKPPVQASASKPYKVAEIRSVIVDVS